MTEDFIPNYDRRCPVAPDRLVRVRLRCGAVSHHPGRAGDYVWAHRGRHPGDITHWRPA
ncbi:hypothetical protein [Sphingomonas oleivorans]|uniref:hypothetical protein n=1 Tax=Sphingomonas oleivorans TaxID=1735121 RepID=UPI0013FDB03D|nr:hypothetical protein [Sphingomonas oleivorans]